MFNYVVDLIMVVLCWLLMAIAYYSWGSIFNRALKLKYHYPDRIINTIWVGWFISILLFNLYNLLFPINYAVSVMFFSTGLVIFIVENKITFTVKDNIYRITENKAILLVLLVTSILIASRSMLAPFNSDSGLYHFNSIRWLNEYAIIPGLGNLHGRLAFNQTFFTYVASLNIFPYFGNGHNLANGFLALLLACQCISGARRYMRYLKTENNLFELNGIVSITILAALIFFVLISSISSPSPDFASVVLQLLLFLSFVNLFFYYREQLVKEAIVGFMIITAATAFTIKLSNVFFAGIITVIALIQIFNNCKAKLNIKAIKPLLSTLIASFIITITWVFRGIITSGYPFYPITVGRFSSDWSMPKEVARNEAAWIYSWARQPGVKPDIVLADWLWIKPWFNEFLANKSGIIYLSLIMIAAALIMAAIVLMMKNKSYVHKTVMIESMLPLLTVLFGLLFWFITAPAIRFANALLFLLPISSFILLQNQFSDKVKKQFWKIRKALIILIILGATVFVGLWSLWLAHNHQLQPLFAFSGLEQIPTAELELQVTTSGIEVWVPIKEGLCWDSPLPSTPYFNENLKFRNDTMQSGFIISE
jgi:hypothetical protein